MVADRKAKPIRLAVVDDYEVVVQGLARMFAGYPDRIDVVELDAGTSIQSPVDIALYETFAMPQADAAELSELLDDKSVGKVVAYSWNMDAGLVERAMKTGISGYLSKSLPARDLVEALEQIHEGATVVSPDPGRALPVGGDWPGRNEGLTNREAEIVALITQGLRNSEIAERTWLSINSVKSYIRTAYRKMGVSSRSQAVAWGIRHGFEPDRIRIREPLEGPGDLTG